jgi:hypothetical protein
MFERDWGVNRGDERSGSTGRTTSAADAPVQDKASAHQALGCAFTAVDSMNLGLGVNQVESISLGNPGDDIIQEARRLGQATGRQQLTEIAKELKASFSISVGTSVSVTINCGPFD